MHNQSIWNAVRSEFHLYEYSGTPLHHAKPCQPVLMLHGLLAGLSSWEPMCEYLATYGLEKLYALEIPELQRGVQPDEAFAQLHAAIRFLLDERHPKETGIVLIGHDVGGLLAYRYWQRYQEAAAVDYLFMVGTPHNTTIFPLLPEEAIRNPAPPANPDKSTQSVPIDFTKVRALYTQGETVLINVMGHQVGPDWYGVLRGMRSTTHFDRIMTHDVGEVYDGLVQGLRLPEAVNLTLTMRQQIDHRGLNKEKRLYELILLCLRGEFYQVKLRLVGIQLRGEDSDGIAGPVAFEINGNRMPHDSIFQGEPGRLFLFEDSVPPLATLHYPLGTISAPITLHLKDLSKQRGKRRRMYTRLYVPLRHEGSIAHTMQDSEGSDFIWRITCKRMPRVLHDPSFPDPLPELSRGI